jgi:hypothetical protein
MERSGNKRIHSIQMGAVPLAQILKWWPAMVETARRLRAEGHRLAQPL